MILSRRLGCIRCVWLVVALYGLAAPGAAQTGPQPGSPREAAPSALRVFLDCHDDCDFDFLRTEITFVDYVRDRKDADVHVLVTTQRTGGGGREFTLKFIGLERFAGRDDTLRYVSPQTDTDDQRRRGLAQVLKLGLVRYAAETPLAADIHITHRPAAGAPAATPATPAADPWHFWIFRVGTNGNLFAEQRTRRGSLRGSISANRTTEALKVSASANLNYNESRYDLSEDGEPPDIYVSITRDYNVSGLIVKSVTGHWSAAARVSVSSSTFTNQQRAVRVWTGVEYNLFPYAESTRREFVFNYTVGPNWLRYHEVTIFDKLEETLYSHQLVVALSMRQPWGTAFVENQVSQYLHDGSKNRIDANGRVEVRLFRGFTFNVGGGVSRIRDQIYLPAGKATPEEILVLRRQLATGYRYTLNWGVSYTFGSIYNNVVNPRFDAR
jgi:hypothetical protein